MEEFGGYITDGSGDFRYLPYQNCTWRIQPKKSESSTINFYELSGDYDDQIIFDYDYNDTHVTVNFIGYEGQSLPSP